MTVADERAEPFDLTPVALGELPGFDSDDLASFWTPFLVSCRSIVESAPELRKGRPPSAAHRALCSEAMARGAMATADIRRFLDERFSAFLIQSNVADQKTFYTAYYRPETPASLVQTASFREPLLARPDDLVTLQPEDDHAELAGLSSARRRADGRLEPYPTRAEIDAGVLGAKARPIAYVADAIEAFMIHVQGSARLILDDGRKLDLTYAGRNGRPYSSIGRRLIEQGGVAPDDMSLARLKSWVRAAGQEPGQPGRALLHRNQSFVFFSMSEAATDAVGPIGAAGVPLTPHRSIAVDRSIWAYGLPFWIDVDAPWAGVEPTPFRRLTVSQDTGTAIVGSARADLFFGDGDLAGVLAGGVRHHGRMVVLLPKGDHP